MFKHVVSQQEVLKARKRLAAETGTIVKDWGGKLAIALMYPNSYYIGMSNLGLHAIYGFLNRCHDVVCERLFWEKESGQSLPLALESQRPLMDFAVIAFSVTYEIDYFNIAPVLKASGIPLYSTERDETQPLIIAGGACITANPMPLAPFFDAMCIGEAEVLLPAMLPVLSQGVSGRRADLLKALAKLPGVYVPGHSEGIVTRQWVKKLDDFPVHSVVLTEDTELGDLYLVEVQRGCGHACRFCLVSSAFSPARFRRLDSLVEQASVGLRYRRRIGLMGPAVSDHPQIEELMARLRGMGAGLSISSLRVSSLTARMLEEMAKGGLNTIALAPEAGSECLRRVIKKGITESQVLEAIGNAAGAGMKQLKLYFMIGLPNETDGDIEAIVDLTLAGKEMTDRQRRGARITLNVAPFVPKAGTPFQWLGMAEPAVLEKRLAYLKNKLMPKGVVIKAESVPWSEVQAVLARGDTELAGVLADIERPSLAQWRRAVEKHGVDTDFYAHRRWDVREKLPWAVLEVKTEKLGREMGEALSIARS